MQNQSGLPMFGRCDVSAAADDAATQAERRELGLETTARLSEEPVVVVQALDQDVSWTLKARPSKRPRGETRMHWRDSVFRLVWEHLEISPEELLKEAEEQNVPAEAAPSTTHPWKQLEDGWTDTGGNL